MKMKMKNRLLPACLGTAAIVLAAAAPATRACAQTADASAAPESPGSAASAPPAGAPGTGNDKARSEKRNPESSEAPAAEAPQGMLGDFGNGARSDLVRHGLSLNGHLVSESAANLTGGLPLGGTAHDRGTALSSEFGFGFDADFSKIASAGGAGILHFLLTTRFGSNLSSQAIGNLASVQEIYGDGQTTRITYLDYEQPLLKNRLNLRLGKYNQQNDFIAGSSYWGGNLYCFFQNNNICGTPAGIPIDNGVVAGGSEGYVYYPSSQWGGRLKVNVSPDVYVQAAAIQANPIVNNPDGGLYLGFYGGTGVELPLEAGVTLRSGTGDLLGNLRIGAYYDTSHVQNFAARARGNVALLPNETTAAGLASNATAITTIPNTYVRGREGAYVQFDHVLEGSAAAGRTGTALFTAFEYADPQTSLIGTMFEIGAVRRGTFRGRERDTISAGFATENFNVRLQALESALQHAGFTVPNTVQDQVFEVNYGVQATRWFVIRPGVQFVINPSGLKANPGAAVIDPPRNSLVIGIGGYITL